MFVSAFTPARATSVANLMVANFTDRRRAPLWLCLALLALAPAGAMAGGPKYVAGTSFFDPAALGQPIHWAGGQVKY